MSKGDLIKAFRKLDVNGDGFVSHQELQNVMTMVRRGLYWLFMLLRSFADIISVTHFYAQTKLLEKWWKLDAMCNFGSR